MRTAIWTAVVVGAGIALLTRSRRAEAREKSAEREDFTRWENEGGAAPLPEPSAAGPRMHSEFSPTPAFEGGGMTAS